MKKKPHGNTGNQYALKDPVDRLQVVSFRASPTDYANWQEIAHNQGLSFGQWASDKLNHKERKPTLFERKR